MQSAQPGRALLVATSVEEVVERARSVALRQGFEVRPVPLDALGASLRGASTSCILLLDLRLGGPIDAGAIAALRCNPRFAELPVIALVADKDDAAIRDAISAGANDFLREPLLERELPWKLLLVERNWELQRELHQREDTFQGASELFHGHPDAILLVEAATLRILAANHAAERMFPAARGRRGSLLHVFPAAADGQELAALVQVAVSSDGHLLRTLSVFDEGGARWLEVALAPAAEGCVLLSIRDITERQRAQSHRLEQKERATRHALIVELAGAAAPELNHPLTGVLGYAHLLAKRVERGSQTARQLALLRQEAERMAEIVRKLAQVTRYETIEYVEGAMIVDLDRASPSGGEPR
jgi:CheY-like chemotaxis protein